ncbi:MAG: helix-turn-helix domain-containing protein [Thiotrichales bacterium]
MEKVDARTLKKETQEQLRKQAIRLRQQGKTYKEIAEIIGVNSNTVWKWWKKYQADGAKALKAGQRGRPLGVNRLLDIEQEEEIQRLICDKTPDQLKLTFALWTRQAVQELIRMRFGIQIASRTVILPFLVGAKSRRLCGHGRPLFRCYSAQGHVWAFVIV